MIRRGKREGWLNAPKNSLLPWARLNGCQFNGVTVDTVEGKGLAVIGEKYLDDQSAPLMTVSRDMILSKDTIELYAKSDRYLREVLEALGSFGQTTRGAVLTFLLLQATRLCPEVDQKIGVSNPLSEYVKYLPIELLPTFWTQEELDLLQGTSLAPATEAKLKSLFREYEHLSAATSSIDWCRKYWWDEVDGLLSFDDWKLVDAFYRSRALEFPGIGDAMVPCVDMTNHVLLREGKNVDKGEEVTITYGDEKGACEMLFSYGFLEDGLDSARDIFLDLEPQEDDPLGRAKRAVSSSAPGVRLFESSEGLRWESDYLWLICVNEEDGLHIRVAQTVDDGQELSLSWRDQQLESETHLKSMLQGEKLWDLYQLRAVALLQDRIGSQLSTMYSNKLANNEAEMSEDVREQPRLLARKLLRLESSLLDRFYEYFEGEKLRLAQTDTVQDYLNNQADQVDEEDFS